MTDEVIWRLLYTASGVKVEAVCHVQLDETTSLCGMSSAEVNGYWRGLFEGEYAPQHPGCLLLLEQAALALVTE